jgi:hypothetical protein
MGDIIQEIIDRLKSLNEFNFVTIWNNQFQYMQDGTIYSFPMPCALVEVQTNDTQSIGGYVQGSDITVVIHIGQDYYNGSNIDENFNIFQLRDIVVKSISHFKSAKSGIFVKVSEDQDFEHSNVYHYKLTYKTQWIDETAKALEYYTTGTTAIDTTAIVTH